jgi:hypothetical protein
MNSDELTKAIHFLKPGAEFSFQEADYTTIKWDKLDGEAPSIKQLEDALIQVNKAEREAQTAKENRKREILERIGLTEEEAKLILA